MIIMLVVFLMIFVFMSTIVKNHRIIITRIQSLLVYPSVKLRYLMVLKFFEHVNYHQFLFFCLMSHPLAQPLDQVQIFFLLSHLQVVEVPLDQTSLVQENVVLDFHIWCIISTQDEWRYAFALLLKMVSIEIYTSTKTFYICFVTSALFFILEKLI